MTSANDGHGLGRAAGAWTPPPSGSNLPHAGGPPESAPGRLAAVVPWLLVTAGGGAVLTQIFRFTPSLAVLVIGVLAAMVGGCVLLDRHERAIARDDYRAPVRPR